MNGLARLNKPWVHFIALGVIFYQLQSALFPEPKPVIGPISEARIASLKERWISSMGRAPSDEQMAGFMTVELDRDMLVQRALDLDFHLYDSIVYQRLIRNMKFLQLADGKSDAQIFKQALGMQLHLDDEVVKRRLIQMMEQRLLANNPPPKPSAAEIEAVFIEKREALRRPPLYSIEHVFFPAERAPEVVAVIAKITDQGLDAKAARELGAPFLQGHRFIKKTPSQLARNFGKGFVRELESELSAIQAVASTNAKQPQWLGPISSVYGVHYVWLADFTAARDARLDEVKQQLRRDLEYSANRQALQCAIKALRADFDLRGGGKAALDKEGLCE